MTTEDGTDDYIQFLRQRGIITHIVSGKPGDKMLAQEITQSCVANDVACPVPLPDGTVGINAPDGIPEALAALDLSIEAIEDNEKSQSEAGELQETIDATLDEIEAALSKTTATMDTAHTSVVAPIILADRSHERQSDLDAAPSLQDAEDTPWDSDAEEIGMAYKTETWDATAAFVAPESEPALEEAPEFDVTSKADKTCLEKTEVAAQDPLAELKDQAPPVDKLDAESETALQDPKQLALGEDVAETTDEAEDAMTDDRVEIRDRTQVDTAQGDDVELDIESAISGTAENTAAAALGTDLLFELDEKISRMMKTHEHILDRLEHLTDIRTGSEKSEFDVGRDRLMTAFGTALRRFTQASNTGARSGLRGENVSLAINGSDVRTLASLQEIMALQMANLLENPASDPDSALHELIMDLRHAVAELASRQESLEQSEKPADYLAGVTAA